MAQPKRLLALDILRGITIAGMLLVNNPGTWSSIYAPLEHAEWEGLTPTDLVFPFFVFVMGVSMYFSLRKFNFTLSGQSFFKIVKRTVILFLIGWAVSWFAVWLRGLFNPDIDFVDRAINHLRILGVFQRLALAYFFGSMIAVTLKHRFIPWLIGLILVAYAIILAVGHGYDVSADNIIARIDNAVLGENHMYKEGVFDGIIAFDPEGILSTLPCIAHVLIGLMVGKLITTYHNNTERITKLALLGIVMVLGGWLLQYGIPCGKKMWSSTFVLITCGMASCLLALLIYIIDVKGHNKWCRFFQSFGVNPLFCYLVGTILSIAFSAIKFGTNADGDPVSIHSLIHDGCKAVTWSPESASCLYAIVFVCICWMFGYILYKKKIYIKI
jgi:predicted acyltransferase